MKRFIASLALIFWATCCAADDFSYIDDLNTRAQLGSKVVGITVVESCPFEDVVQRIIDEGKAMGADDTVFLPVASQENCPANLYGAVRPYIDVRHDVSQPDGLWHFETYLGVTIGVHYRLVK